MSAASLNFRRAGNGMVEIRPIWIPITQAIPPLEDRNHESFVLAFHSEYGVGVAWFYRLDEGCIQEMEEATEHRYLCSASFVKNKTDGDYLVDLEDDIDIFDCGALFGEGTVTHWMSLPSPPYPRFNFGPNPGDG